MLEWNEELTQRLIQNFAIPGVALAVGATVLAAVFGYIWSLRVEGKANEWVIIINNGELKNKGIGLNCFKGPFDQVVTFPSKVNKVEFSTE